MLQLTLANMTTDFGGHQLPSESGFHTAMLIGAVVALIAAGVAAAIPMQQKLTDGRHHRAIDDGAGTRGPEQFQTAPVPA